MAESMHAGDVLFGSNQVGAANMKWDVNAGRLLFRGGTTVQAYIDTDGSIKAGGGHIKISDNAHILFSVSGANRGLTWYTGSTFATECGYIDVSTAYLMTINTGSAALAGWQDFRIDNRSSAGGGSTRTPLYIDAEDKEFRVYPGDTAAQLICGGSINAGLHLVATGIVKVGSGTADPSGVSDGSLFYRSDLGELIVRKGGAWKVVFTSP